MCSAAHGWVGLGPIVYASSSAQFVEWQKELGLASFSVRNLSIQEVIMEAEVEGPDEELAKEVYRLHVQANPE